MRKKQKSLKSEQGSVLLFITIVLLIALLFAAGLYVLSSTSLFSQPLSTLGERTTYLAEAGYRYAASEFLNEEDIVSKFNRLEELDKSSFQFQDGSSFTLHIYPYFLRVSSDYNEATTIILKAPGTLPTHLNFPAEGNLKINSETYSYTQGTKIDSSQVKVTLNQPITVSANAHAYFVFYPKYSQTLTTGSSLVLAGNDTLFSILPLRNGYIEINGENYFYHFKEEGSIVLTELRKEDGTNFNISIDEDTEVLLKTSAIIESEGIVGQSPLKVSRKVAYYIPITDELKIPGGGEEAVPLSNEPGGQDTFENLNNWDTGNNHANQYVDTNSTIGTNHGYFKNRMANFHDLPLVLDLNPVLMESGTQANLRAIWGNSFDNVYVVGDGGIILHYDGSSWNKMTSPVEKNLRDIYGFGSKGEEKIIAVGDEGTILKWEGNNWEKVLMKDGRTFSVSDLYAVWGTSWNHITTYGDYGTSPFKWYREAGNWYRKTWAGWPWNSWYYERIYFSNGIQWRPYDITSWEDRHFRKSWEIESNGNTSIFICGQTTQGKAFIFREKPDQEAYFKTYKKISSFNSIWGSNLNDIYVVGSKGNIYHNNKQGEENSWNPQNSPTSNNLNGIWGQNCGNLVYSVGDKGTLIYKVEDSSWTSLDLNNITKENLNEVWSDEKVGIYAVGDKGTILFLGYVENPYKYFILPLKKLQELSNFWQNNNKLLTYTAQVKIGWGYKLKYAATGINFRWAENLEYKDKYEGYGVSFMFYRPSSEECTNDYIPNSIKPFYKTDKEVANKLLLVLWKQEVKQGQIKRTWIAYKDLTEDVKILGDSWQYSGRLEDLTSLFLRIEEKKINGQKVNEVKIFYGDASTNPRESHIADNLYDNTNRKAYNPTYSKTTSPVPITWPLWDLSAWQESSDFFTLIRDVSVAANPQPATSAIHYWILNPEVSEATLLEDEATIRLTQFTSPEGDKFYNDTGQNAHSRPEIGLHAFGDIQSIDSNTFVSFSEFALSLGKSEAGIDQDAAFGTLY